MIKKVTLLHGAGMWAQRSLALRIFITLWRGFCHKKARIGLLVMLFGLMVLWGWRSWALITFKIKSLDPNALVTQLQINERWQDSPLSYLPFIPILKWQHRTIEKALLESAPADLGNITEEFRRYYDRFRTEAPIRQREMILALAQYILVKQSLFEHDYLVDSFERLRYVKKPVSDVAAPILLPYIQLALQRAQWRLQPEKSELTQLRQLLARLVESDPQWRWLLASASNASVKPAVNIWLHSLSMDDFPDLWTLVRVQQVNDWLETVEQAVGDDIALTTFTAFRQQWPSIRQENWLELLFNVVNEDFPPLSAQEWQDRLLSIRQGSSPSMEFARQMNLQLSDISEAQSQPWLQEHRRLIILDQYTTRSPNMGYLHKIKQQWQQRIERWLMPEPRSAAASTKVSLRAWQAWREALSFAVEESIKTAQDSRNLTEGLFQQQEETTSNPLQRLFQRYVELQKGAGNHAQDLGIMAVWKLYQSDGDFLLAHAIRCTGCWVQKQWEDQVLEPMNQNGKGLSYDERQALAWQYVSDFLAGPAQAILSMSEKGPQINHYQGKSAALTPGFLGLLGTLSQRENTTANVARKNMQQPWPKSQQDKALKADSDGLRQRHSLDINPQQSMASWSFQLPPKVVHCQ
ncbi:hypothetical protein [Yersinia entomophaga]|nr:hypothetical protein [Yersinia entomophaga]